MHYFTTTTKIAAFMVHGFIYSFIFVTNALFVRMLCQSVIVHSKPLQRVLGTLSDYYKA